MHHSRILEELKDRVGGMPALAAKFGLSNSTLCHWKNDDGIPPRHWPKLLRIAEQYDYKLTLKQIEIGPARPDGTNLVSRKAA